MPEIKNIFLENRAWVKEKLQVNPDYFKKLANDQKPTYLWIGCSDSRVLPNEITGTSVGDIFTHRNIANLVVEDDGNLESVVVYALKYLKVEQVIVCGHYGCGGVKCAMTNESFGVIDKWLKNIKDIILKSKYDLDSLQTEEEKFEKLVELNVIDQVEKFVKKYGYLREFIPSLNVYGWVYDMRTGFLKSLIKKKI